MLSINSNTEFCNGPEIRVLEESIRNGFCTMFGYWRIVCHCFTLPVLNMPWFCHFSRNICFKFIIPLIMSWTNDANVAHTSISNTDYISKERSIRFIFNVNIYRNNDSDKKFQVENFLTHILILDQGQNFLLFLKFAILRENSFH